MNDSADMQRAFVEAAIYHFQLMRIDNPNVTPQAAVADYATSTGLRRAIWSTMTQRARDRVVRKVAAVKKETEDEST